MADYSPHQLRVLTERTVLEEKITKLSAFINSPQFVHVTDPVERQLLVMQEDVMVEYRDILDRRVALWGTK